MADYRQEARLYKDGNAWCAVGPGFRNLAIDTAGFGDTQEEAVVALHKATREERPLEKYVVGGFCRRCQDWVAEDETPEDCDTADCPCKKDSTDGR